MSTKRSLARACAVLAVAGTAAVLGAGAASAHVTAKVIGETAAQGGYTKITFRVPNEDSAAGTVKLEIRFPQEFPLTSVRTKPVAGWTAQITKFKLDKPVDSHGTQITEGVSSVTWTAAAGTRIGPGEFGEFEVSAGRLPETERLVIPAIQTYDSGKVVAWDAPPPAEGGEEPERPAPVVELTEADDDDHADTAVAKAGHETEAHDDDKAEAASGTDDTARWLGGAGLAVGALGLGLGAGATLRARRAVAKAGQ